MKHVLSALLGCLREGASVRDGADLVSWESGRFRVAERGGSPGVVHDEEARERLAWLILNEYEVVAGFLAPHGFDADRARADLEASKPDLVARVRLPLDPAGAIFDAFANGYKWERGDRESFDQVLFRDGHVVWEEGDPLRTPSIVASTSYDRAEFSRVFNTFFDLRRSQPVVKDDRAAVWYAHAQQSLRFVTLRMYQLAAAR